MLAIQTDVAIYQGVVDAGCWQIDDELCTPSNRRFEFDAASHFLYDGLVSNGESLSVALSDFFRFIASFRDMIFVFVREANAVVFDFHTNKTLLLFRAKSDSPFIACGSKFLLDRLSRIANYVEKHFV